MSYYITFVFAYCFCHWHMGCLELPLNSCDHHKDAHNKRKYTQIYSNQCKNNVTSFTLSFVF